MGEDELNHALPGAAPFWLSSCPQQDRTNPAGVSEQKSSVRNTIIPWRVIWPDLTWVSLKRDSIPTVPAETLLWLVIQQAEHYPHRFKKKPYSNLAVLLIPGVLTTRCPSHGADHPCGRTTDAMEGRRITRDHPLSVKCAFAGWNKGSSVQFFLCSLRRYIPPHGPNAG